MTEPIDRLIFALDGDLTLLKQKFVEADALAKKTGTSIQSNLGGAFKGAANDVARNAEQLKSLFGGVEGHAGRARESVFVLTREIRALLNELSSGRMTGAVSTLGIIGIRLAGLRLATLAWTAGVLAVPAAFAAAAISAENSMGRIRSAIAITGNASGLTSAQASTIAAQIAGGGRMSEVAARSFVSSGALGLMPAASLATAGLAAGNYRLATGANAADTDKLFKGMFEDPTKSAQELNAQFRLLTAAQTREVEDLQKSGQYERAGQVILDAFANRTRDAADQVSVFSKALNTTGVFFGNLWAKMGLAVGGGLTDADRLRQLENSRAAILSGRTPASQGVPGSSVLGLFGSLFGSGPNTSVVDKQIADLKTKMAADQTRADADAKSTAQQKAITDALADADKEGGNFQNRIRELKDELARDELAVKAARDTHSEFTSVLVRQRDAVRTALANQITPAREAELRAGENERLRNARPEDRARVQAELDAEREFRRNLANPATAPYARSIFNTQMLEANVNPRAAQQRETLNDMQFEAQAERDVADAYRLGTAAVEQAKITNEANRALLKGQIADEQSYADALRKRAFAQAEATAAEANMNTFLENQSRQGALAAGGNPAALAQARILEQARQRTQSVFNAATTPEQLSDAIRQFKEAVAGLTEQQRQEAVLAGQSRLFGAEQALTRGRQTFGALAAGATPDDLRHLQVAQQVFDELIATGLDPATDDFKQLYEKMLAVNEQTSDLTDAFDKLRQKADDFANAVTGPISELFKPHPDLRRFGFDVASGVTQAGVKDFIQEPLNDYLKGAFGDLFGIDKPDGSPGKPFYIHDIDSIAKAAGGSPGGGGIAGMVGGLFGNSGGIGNAIFGSEGVGGLSGILGTTGGTYAGGAGGASFAGDYGASGLLGSLFGGGSAAAEGGAAASSSGFLSGVGSYIADLFSFLADGGTIRRGQRYIVGEDGPEYIDEYGNVTPLTAPTVDAGPRMMSPGPSGRSGSSQAGGSSNFYEEHYHAHFPELTDFRSVVQARSQMAAAVADLAERGRRNR